MNIAFVNFTHKWGGVKTWVINTGIALEDLGHRVEIYGRPGNFIEKSKNCGLNATSVNVGPDFSPYRIIYFIREFIKNKITVVIVNVSKDMRTAGIAAWLLNIPIIHRIGAPGDLKNRFSDLATQRNLKPILLSCSNFVQQKIKNNIPLLNDYEFYSIHPGIKPCNKVPNFINSVRQIIVTSQLNSDKGHIDLLNALSELKKKNILFKCIIAGTGSDEEKLKQQSDKLKLKEYVKWFGFTTDVYSLLEEGDIFVLPSYEEPLGIALEEAMGYGLIPIARRSGGVPEIWPDNHKEFLINPESGHYYIQHALEILLSLNDEELLMMKQNILIHATKKFHIKIQAKKLENMINEKVISRPMNNSLQFIRENYG